MVTGLAFLATAISTVFAQSTLARATRSKRPQDRAWSIALAQFAIASAALALGSSTGWDIGTFRVFYLFGAVLNVPWLALGTVYLLAGTKVGHRVEKGLLFFTGLAVGVVLTAPIEAITSTTVPIGKDLFGPFPRILAAAGSGIGATFLIGGAIYSAIGYVRHKGAPGAGRMVGANCLITLGTITLSAGGIFQGFFGGGRDLWLAASLALGIGILFAGFLVASRPHAPTHGAQSGEFF